MADISKVLPILYKAEFSNPDNALEWNKTESGWTFMGIYQSAHPTWTGWNIVNEKLRQYNGDRKKVSPLLYDNNRMREYVEWFYKREFWDVGKLDNVVSQHTASEIFIFGVVANMPPSIRKAQELVGVEVDGIMGAQTLKALNEFDEKVFDYEFDEEEIEYFKATVARNPQKARFLDGWINRAHLV